MLLVIVVVVVWFDSIWFSFCETFSHCDKCLSVQDLTNGTPKFGLGVETKWLRGHSNTRRESKLSTLLYVVLYVQCTDSLSGYCNAFYIQVLALQYGVLLSR